MPELGGTLRDIMRGELLAYAVGRAIHCPDCGRIMDASSSVLYSGASSAIACGDCWDRNIAAAAAARDLDPARVVELLADGDELAIIDGREL